MKTIEINEEDVKYCIGKLNNYSDSYTNGVVSVLKRYLEHQDFKQMRDDLETVSPHDRHNLWDINARMGFFEVIYPA